MGGRKKKAEVSSASSSSASSGSESEDDNAEEVPMAAAAAATATTTAAAAAAPPTQNGIAPAPTQRGFDPMNQFLGIPAYQTQNVAMTPQMQAQQQRVGAVKATMNPQQAQMQMRMQQQQQQQQMMQNMYNTQMGYQTNAAYRTNAGYNNMQLVAVNPYANYNTYNHMPAAGGMTMGQGMNSGALVQYQDPGAALIPAMEAERTTHQATDYRVRRGTKPTRINASDQAFGPLLDQMMKR